VEEEEEVEGIVDEGINAVVDDCVNVVVVVGA